MNLSMNNHFFNKSPLQLPALSVATTRTDSRSSGINVGPRKLLMIPIMNLSMNNSFLLKVIITFRAFCRNDKNRLKIFWDECWAKKAAHDTHHESINE
jgi:hypothetical protein